MVCQVVYCFVAVIRGVKSYDDYIDLFNSIKPEDHEPASKHLFARFTGITTAKPSDQVKYNKTWRHKTKAELDELRALNALAWIDDNIEPTLKYITDKQNNTLQQ